MKKFTNKLVALAAVLVASVALSFVAAVPAFANNELTVTNENGVAMHVSDAVTEVKVAKLDADTQEYISGATMQIIEKDNPQNVVDSWVSTDSSYDCRKKLNVDTHYILREISAPDGYSVAKDTEFYLDATEGYGVHIVSGDDAELYESTTIKLYDKKGSTTREITTYKASTTSNAKTGTTTKVKAPQTDDTTPIAAVAIAVAVCIAAILGIQVYKRHQAKN